MIRFKPEEKTLVIKLFHSGMSLTKIARRFKVSRTTIRNVLRKAGEIDEFDNYSTNYIPSPQEIRQRAEAIKARWTEEQRRQRAGIVQEPVSIRFVKLRNNRKMKPARD
jgi:transposase